MTKDHIIRLHNYYAIGSKRQMYVIIAAPILIVDYYITSVVIVIYNQIERRLALH